METTNNENQYYKAKKRVAQLKKFYTSIMSYVIVISFLAAINYYSNQWEYMWFLWAAFGWGIGIFFQATKTFGWNPILGKDWETRKLKQFMDEEDRKNTLKK